MQSLICTRLELSPDKQRALLEIVQFLTVASQTDFQLLTAQTEQTKIFTLRILFPSVVGYLALFKTPHIATTACISFSFLI